MNLIQKRKIEKIIMQYNKHFLEQINSNLELIINAFITYYGEEFQDIITRRIKSTNIYSYISNCTIEVIYDYLINTKSYDNDFMQIFNAYKNKDYFAKILDNEIKLDNFYKKQIIENLSSNVQINGFHVFTFDNYNNPIRNVFVALFSDEQNLFHELNHTITSELLALEIINDKDSATIVQNGMSISYASNHYKVGNGLEEIINDKIASEITDIFHKLGGFLPKYEIKYPETIYSELFHVIDKFYTKYKDLLKIVRITGDTNMLFTKINKDKFIEFQEMIDKCLEIVSYGKRVPNGVSDSLLLEMDKCKIK